MQGDVVFFVGILNPHFQGVTRSADVRKTAFTAVQVCTPIAFENDQLPFASHDFTLHCDYFMWMDLEN